MKFSHILGFSLSLTAVNIAVAQQTQSIDEIERITVVSDFRQLNLEQLAASATILDQQSIQQQQAQHLDDLFNIVPNINFSSGASRGRFVQIRGIGERSQFSEPLNSSVSFTIDNIDASGLFALANPFDIAQVEVLRGPQPTAYGVGALAGAIRFVGAAPGAATGNQAVISYGQHDTWRAGVAYGNDINQHSAFRVSWIEQGSDGEEYNIFWDKDDTNAVRERAGRVAYELTTQDGLSLLVNYRFFDIDNNYDAFSLDNDRRTRSDEQGFDRNETHALGLTTKWRTDAATVALIGSHSTSKIGYGYDEDWTFDGFHPFGYTSFDAYYRDIDTSTLELRATSNQPFNIGQQSVDWVVGAVTQQRDEQLLRNYTFADSDFGSTYKPQSIAVYSRFDTPLSDNVAAQFGVRLERSELDYADSNGFVEGSSDTLLGGKVSINYQYDTFGVLYSSISRGYKAGGFNPDERVTDEARIYEPEYNWNYEVGVKQRIMDGLGSIRMAVFYMRRQNTQINDFDVIVREDDTPDFIDIIANASIGTNKGIELETDWALHANWHFAVNLGYLRATFEDYTTADGTLINKQEQAQAPRFTANVVSEWQIRHDLAWRIELEAKDDYRFSDGHDERSLGYGLINSSIDWQLDSWLLQAWVKNATDKVFYTRGFGGFSNDPRDAYAQPEPYFQFGRGRTVGVTAQYQF